MQADLCEEMCVCVCVCVGGGGGGGRGRRGGGCVRVKEKVEDVSRSLVSRAHKNRQLK